MKKILVAAVALSFGTAYAGEWHTGQNNLCTDCHTMHFSQTHTWDGTGAVSSTPAANGNWLGGTGPNNFLLKLPANELCKSCHDGQTFAPDVFETNTNAASYTQGRSAGALNETGTSPYQTFKGHTLGSTATPPGFNPVVVGLSATWYDPAGGLECISCHTQHGLAGVYRNLGPRSLGTAALPSYVINTTNDVTKDVWINIASGYAANSGNPSTFGPFYDNASTKYNRRDRTVGTTQTSNGLDTMCAACHGNFHGGPTDAAIANGGTIGGLDGFIRHPTSGITIGASSTGGYGGHSALSRYTAATTTTKIKTYSNNGDLSDASPGCMTCHKAHGNQNPFGLIFLSRTATSVGEEGGYATGQVEAANGYQVGYRNLCGQCHSQGN